MKIKGISPIEHHIEKLVLVVFALFAMAMFVLQFNIFGDPNAVDIGQRKNVAPGNAIDVVREDAQKLEGELDENVDVDTVVPTVVGPFQRIQEALGTPAIDPSMWNVVLGPSSRPVDIVIKEPTPGSNGAQLLVDVRPPAPTAPAARAFGATINPFVPHQIPDLQSAVPADQPYDLRAVSVQASFPSQEFRTSLALVPDNDKVRPLPRAWWDGKVEILDVEVVRDELGPDGAVVASSTVPPVPGFPSVRAMLADPKTLPRDLPQIQEIESDARAAIRRTPLYSMIAGEPWVWPSLAAERNAADPNRQQVERLVAERRSTARELEKVMQTLRPPGGAGPAPESGDKNAPPTPPPPPDAGSRDATAGANPAVAKRIADLQKKIQDIDSRLRDEFNRDPDGVSLEREAEAVFSETVTSLTASDAPPAITIWTHDLRPEPGKTYQYRVRVWVTNPLCGNGAGLPPEQQALAEDLAIPSDWSDPTAPITIQPSPAFFVASATTGEGLGGAALRRPASATLDLFEFHYGFWRGGSATIAPGDQVRSEIKIDAMPIFEIKTDANGALVLGGTTQGPESLSISRESILVSVISAGTNAGDIVILANADGSLEIREAGTDAESPAESRMRDSAAKSVGATVAIPTPTGASNDKKSGF